MFIVEDGSGVVGANSLITPAYVTAYLTDRDRATENGWTSPEGAEEQAACVAATDYIENRFGQRLRGEKQFQNTNIAKATLTLTGLPSSTQTVTIGATAYRFVASISLANDVVIGETVSESITNLLAAIADDPDSAEHSATEPNPDVTAYPFFGDSIVVYARAAGTAPNSIDTTTTVTGASWNFATLHGGTNVIVPQPLCFPRRYLYDRDGILMQGVPTFAKYAGAEYAVRARAGAKLVTDPTIATTGGELTGDRVTVGPITIDQSFSVSGSAGMTSQPYPEVDRLFAPYLQSYGAAVIRG